MKRLTAVMASCVMLCGACGSPRAPTPPRKSGSRILEVASTPDAKNKDADAEKNSGEEDLLSPDADIETEPDPGEVGGEGDSASIGTGSDPDPVAEGEVSQEDPMPADEKPAGKDEPGEKQKTPGAMLPTQPLTVTTLKKRKKDVRAFVQSGKNPARELLWPNDEDATAANEGLCLKGQVTEISFKIYSEDKGDLLPGSEEVGILKVSLDSVEFGYEEDGCDDDLCQNDNVIRLHCADGIKVAKPS